MFTSGVLVRADPALGFMTREEYDRLFAALAAAPSSEAEDQKLLHSGVFAGKPAFLS